MELGRGRGRRVEGDTAVMDAPEAEVDLPEQDSEKEDTNAAPASTEAEAPNLNAFWAAVDAVEGDDYSGVITEYGKLSRGGKLLAKNGIRSRVMAAVDNDEYATAKALGNASKAIGTVASSTAGTTADPTEELVNRVAALRLASIQLTSTELEDRISALVVAPNEIVTALAKRLTETKMGRKPRAEGGTRHNVGKHIAQIFADKEAGTFMDVKAITEAKSDEYGEDNVSVASVSAHLKSGKFEQAGLAVVEVDKKLGVRKS